MRYSFDHTSIAKIMHSVTEINAMSAEAFARVFGAVYEHSPWVAQRAFAFKPFQNRSHLHSALVASVQSASESEQLGLLNAHPELAGKEAATGTLTSASTHEQASAGLTAMTAELVRDLQALNAQYLAQFGFPFIIAVRNNTQAAIFATLRARLQNTAAMELNNALMNVGEIARLRLRDIVKE
jgi:2-oxo-4-hydroxy-4-carboxy-5-ureidoimidazoline decarboxylase